MKTRGATILFCLAALRVDAAVSHLRSTKRDEISCPEGGIPDPSHRYCCPEACESCGGYGCHSRPGGEEFCCTYKTMTSCKTNSLPCILEESDSEDSVECSNEGIKTSVTLSGFCNVEVCCPSSCSICDTSPECDEPFECCALLVALPAEVSDIDVSCRDHDPPCVLPPNPDPCAENPCQNGAQCSYTWQGNYYLEICSQRVQCLCEELEGSYAGDYCEIECMDGETPCGDSYDGFNGNIIESNDVCCTTEQKCVTASDKYGYSSGCFTAGGPTTCDPNPCMNGATCTSINSYEGHLLLLPICNCPDGFDGLFCENIVY